MTVEKPVDILKNMYQDLKQKVLIDRFKSQLILLNSKWSLSLYEIT